MKKPTTRHRSLLGVLSIAVLSAGLLLALSRTLPFFTLVDDRIADLRVARLTPAEAAHGDIVVLRLTEETLVHFAYRSPVDRGQLAAWLEALERAGARAVAFDIVFDQPTEPAKDRRFEEAVASASIPVIVAWMEGPPDGSLTELQAAFQSGYLPTAIRGRPTLRRDDAGVVRWIPGPASQHSAATEPVRALAAAVAQAVGVPPPAGDLEIAFRGPTPGGEPRFPTYDAHLLEVLPPEWFAGRIVLVGVDLPWTDRHRTPLSLSEGTMPGVLVHAHALAQILDGRRAARAGPLLVMATVTLLTLAGGLLAMLRSSLASKVVLAGISMAAFWAGSFYAYQAGGLLIAPFLPTLGLGVSFALSSAYLGRLHLRQKRAIREAFGRYVAPAVVRQLEAEPERLQLGGESREVTYVFSDIAGFTGLSERMEPAELVRVLNEYLDGMTRVVLDHRGTIDKFIGDAVVSMFNAPEEQADHAERAVRCALAMDRFATVFAAAQSASGLDFGITRIGVHTGTAVVGNFGGRDRFDYTAIGDTVNIAARLEGANKYLGTRICVSGETARRCREALLRPVGELVLKGKTAAIEVYEPLAGGLELTAYEEAYRLLEAAAPEARAALQRLADAAPEDPVVALHLRRLADGENGVRIVMTGK